MKLLLTLSVILALGSAELVRIPLSHRNSFPTGEQHIANAKARYRTFSLNKKANDPLTNVQDLFYYGPVELGTPKQEFLMDFDTGSTYFWVNNKDCKGCGGKGYYDHSKSSTYKANGTHVNLSYGSGDASGFLSYDDMCIQSACVKKQEFMEATSTDNMPSQANGLLGMAFTGLSSLVDIPAITTVFENMVKQKSVSSPVFSFYLSRDENGKKGGELTLGGSDPKHYHGKLEYIDLTSATFWEVKLEGMSLDKKENLLGSARGKGYSAILDTGTSLLIGPENVIYKIVDKLGGELGPSGLYEVHCSKVPSLPDVTIHMNGKEFKLSSKYYVLKIQGKCALGFMPNGFEKKTNLQVPDFILGDVFLGAYYSQYDVENKRVGLARAK